MKRLSFKKFGIHIILKIDFQWHSLLILWGADIEQIIHQYFMKKGYEPVYIKGHQEHLHILFSYSEEKDYEDIYSMFSTIKDLSSQWIKKNTPFKQFCWESDSVFFIVSSQDLFHKMTVNVLNQEALHQKISFPEEYKHLIEASELGKDWL
jgi:hypothetical protein